MTQLSLAAIRVDRGMTQQDVADRLGVSKNLVVGWESGNQPVKEVYIYALAYLYKIEIDNMRIPS